MTTIYIPQRIDTAEQAASLPNGTIAIEPDAEADRFSLMRVTYDGLDCWITDKKIYTIDFPVGWEALVPVEVTEGPGGHGRSWYINAPEFD